MRKEKVKFIKHGGLILFIVHLLIVSHGHSDIAHVNKISTYGY